MSSHRDAALKALEKVLCEQFGLAKQPKLVTVTRSAGYLRQPRLLVGGHFDPGQNGTGKSSFAEALELEKKAATGKSAAGEGDEARSAPRPRFEASQLEALDAVGAALGAPRLGRRINEALSTRQPVILERTRAVRGKSTSGVMRAGPGLSSPSSTLSPNPPNGCEGSGARVPGVEANGCAGSTRLSKSTGRCARPTTGWRKPSSGRSSPTAP